MKRCLILLLTVVGGVVLIGNSLRELPAKAEPAQSETKSSYANTPAPLVPYRHFRSPNRLFYDKPMVFRGYGREEVEPSLQGIDSVKIGLLAPLENAPDAQLGQQMLNGAQLAIDEANAAGGYKGVPFSLAIRNDMGAWKGVTHEMMQLAHEDKVWAVLGSIDGGSTHVALRMSLKLGVPIVNTASTDPTLTETGLPWIVRVTADDRQFSYALAWHIFKKKGHRAVAMIRENSRYGRTGVAEFKDAARRMGYPLLFEVRYGAGETDFGMQLERIHKSPADSVVLWGSAPEMAQIVKQMRARGMTQPIYGCDRLVSAEFLAAAGSAGEGVVAAAAFNPYSENPLYQAFVQRYKARFKTVPDAFAAHGYDGMNLLLKAVQKAGLNRLRIRDALFATNRFQGVTGEIVLDYTANDVGPVWLAQAQNGTFQFSPVEF